MTTLTATVQDIYANFGKGNIPPIVALFADDIRFAHDGGPDVPYAKDRHGKAEAAAFFSDLAATVEVTQFVVEHCVEQGDTVVALGRWAGRARNTGKSFACEWAMRWTFAAGKVTLYRSFHDTLAMAKAFAA